MPDYNTTATYAFGYADVTPNGSPATYGDAVNPYTLYTTAKTGGDGFDLEWAVNPSTKLPVNVNGKVFKYVRVYSAVLDNATFGETSTEVCGIFTTANGLKTTEGRAVDVGRTGGPTVRYGNSETQLTKTVSTKSNKTETVSVGAGTHYISASSSAENLYINVTKVVAGQAYEFNVTSGQSTYLRVIAQNGTQAPFIKLIEFK